MVLFLLHRLGDSRSVHLPDFIISCVAQQLLHDAWGQPKRIQDCAGLVVGRRWHRQK